ncbi:hypothetical protein [Methanoculleus chikugoensis]|uniref:hypothetical protein n=1 Tax=Methanoculleus chikugoensis TaxID=118126 RepID=UPI001FB1D4A3|nr:hypothetical protein [Methanoculleus chikugoensis]
MPGIVRAEPLERHLREIGRAFGFAAAAGALEPDVTVCKPEPGPRAVLLLHLDDAVAPDVPVTCMGHACGKQPAPVAPPVPVPGLQDVQPGKGERLAVVDDRDRAYRLPPVEFCDEEPSGIGGVECLRVVNPPRVPPPLLPPRPVDGGPDLPPVHRPHEKSVAAHDVPHYAMDRPCI